MTKREAISDILQTIVTDGLPGPRDMDVALDAIFETLELDEVGEPKKSLNEFPATRWRSSVFITIGRGKDLAIKEALPETDSAWGTAAQLALVNRNGQGMSLGFATVQRITNLQRFLESMKGLV